jgi:hypothetical protein
MDNWDELEGALTAMAACGCCEVREDGVWLVELSGLHCELRRQGKNALVHLWSDEKNLTRRVVRVKEQSPERIVLEVQRFGTARPGRLEFLRTDSQRTAGVVTREQFRARFRRFLHERFPDTAIDSLSAARDLKHSFSGLYVRGRMKEGRHLWPFLAVSAAESAATIDGMLTFGLLWLDWTRAHAEGSAVAGLRLFVPEGTSRVLCERALGLSPAARTEIFEYDERESRIRRMDPADAGNIESELTLRRDIEAALTAAQPSAGLVRSLAPNAAGSDEILAEIETRVLPGAKEVGFCFRGLEFARWSSEGVLFGLGDSQERLSKQTEPALKRLIRRLDNYRSALASETNHSLYRAAPERWLETIILEDPSRVDAQLDPAHHYSQVPAMAAGDRGVLDLLGITRKGRLVVIELKASEDIQMLMQAVDYWLRVRRHQREGDFQRFGYFGGKEIDSAPPLVWLLAPGLQFHSATDVLLKYVSSEIQITRIGINENWRRGPKVIFRQ